MKTITKVLALALAAPLLVFAQCDTWTTSTIRNCNNYDYELWNQNNSGTVSMKINGNSTVGGTFTAQWSGTENVLFRAGKKWGSSSTTTVSSIGNAVLEFAATWSSGDNVKMLGIYGWAYYPSGSVPTKQENGTSATFSDQIEYYIIQDRGSYNPASSGTNAKKYGSATIDGIVYDFYVCDRINQPMLTGNGNFKQYFSVPQSTGSHRTSGTVTVSKHFEEWHKAGMIMSTCRLYEIAMKVESYTGSSKNSSGNATVTKNLLTIGGSLPSSNSGGGTSSAATGTSSSSSGQAVTQATNCNNFIGTLPANPNPPANPYTACFKHTNNNCYVCKVSNEGDGNTCSSTWVWDGNNVADNVDKGYWYQSVTCPASSSSAATVSSSSATPSSSSVASSSSSSKPSSSSAVAPSSSSATQQPSSSSAGTTIILNKTPLTHFAVRTSGKALIVETSSPATVNIYSLKGKKVAAFNVSGSQMVELPLPNGMYFAKIHGVSAQHVRFVIK
ncbi:MAG: glycoside hydrolase family 11 protein [Fibromonadales bacterium]|nr:glycoside hydrolase family 11 protein [Fibromonadales bacterium]